MTVKEMIRALEKIDNKDLPIFRQGGEYNGDWRRVQKVSLEEVSAGQFRGVYVD